ncbi:DUF3945 domain-containing protein [Carboxylicivirga mesophila]|uniref:DUF3945 domain-containing protein n=1 Tax=Carboxylicivirga mesophila TaxID=1166478 RepID=A0ABS5K720_9BACT|nr:DUF3945 domain-containing protein [Carboxylicivirga mesophila]MBS2210717.1 DUF3945 domain-containing protein [Carboxylicivirga mesophila]
MMEQKTRYGLDEVPMDKLEKMGIKRDFIDKMEQKELTDFLNGFRSQKLYTVSARINDENYRIPAKIRLQREEGEIKVRIHPIQRLHIPDSFMGHAFSKEEKAALLQDKNIGKTIELQDFSGKKDKYYIGIDAKTNEIIPLKQKNIQIADAIKGVTLTAAQKEKLSNGEKVQLKGMTGRNDKKFSATLQINPAERNIGFSNFKQEKAATQTQEKSETQKQGKTAKVGG